MKSINIEWCITNICINVSVDVQQLFSHHSNRLIHFTLPNLPSYFQFCRNPLCLSLQIENIDACLSFLAAKGVNIQGLSAEGKLDPCTLCNQQENPNLHLHAPGGVWSFMLRRKKDEAAQHVTQKPFFNGTAFCHAKLIFGRGWLDHALN